MSDINYFAGGVRAKAARRGADEGGGRLEIGGKERWSWKKPGKQYDISMVSWGLSFRIVGELRTTNRS